MPKARLSQDQEIHLTISLDKASAQGEEKASPRPKSPFVDEACLFEIANVTLESGERNTEHGRTTVRLVNFRNEEQRSKIIRMLGESFRDVLDRLVPYLHLLGAQPQAAVRWRAAETVGELMREVDFIRFKEDIITPWAQSADLLQYSSAGIALEVAARGGRYEANVKALLKYWISSSNLSFRWAAVASCFQLGTLWPEEVLEILKIAFTTTEDGLDVYALYLSTFVVEHMCHENCTSQVLDKMAAWVSDRSGSIVLRSAMALLFLEVIEFSRISADSLLLDRTVDILLAGLGDSRLIDFATIRSAMLDKLKEWARGALGNPARIETMRTLLERLYIRAGTPREKERIAYHVQRWCRADARFQQVVPPCCTESL